jgi:hypothetical protein
MAALLTLYRHTIQDIDNLAEARIRQIHKQCEQDKKTLTEQYKKLINYEECVEKYVELIVRIQEQYVTTTGHGYRVIPVPVQRLPTEVLEMLVARKIDYYIGGWHRAKNCHVTCLEALGIDYDLMLFMDLYNLHLFDKVEARMLRSHKEETRALKEETRALKEEERALKEETRAFTEPIVIRDFEESPWHDTKTIWRV